MAVARQSDQAQDGDLSTNQQDKIAVHHDALEFPDGQVVLLTVLDEGQQATVLQLPAEPKTAAEAEPKTHSLRGLIAKAKHYVSGHPSIGWPPRGTRNYFWTFAYRSFEANCSSDRDRLDNSSLRQWEVVPCFLDCS